MAVLLALDVGDKRIGVAASDALGLIATPVTTLARGRHAELMIAIRALVEKHAARKIIVGLPKTLANRHSQQTDKVVKFAEQLSEAVDVPVEFWDERLTTAEATRLLRAKHDRGPRSKISRQRHRQMREAVDQVAAAVLLESYLAATTYRHP